MSQLTIKAITDFLAATAVERAPQMLIDNAQMYLTPEMMENFFDMMEVSDLKFSFIEKAYIDTEVRNELFEAYYKACNLPVVGIRQNGKVVPHVTRKGLAGWLFVQHCLNPVSEIGLVTKLAPTILIYIRMRCIVNSKQC
jgi:hypothetical protein